MEEMPHHIETQTIAIDVAKQVPLEELSRLEQNILIF